MKTNWLIILTVLVCLHAWQATADLQSYAYKRTRYLVALVDSAAALLEQQGLAVADQFRQKDSRWFQGSQYLFVYDLQGNNVVHPVQPEFEGKNLYDLRDINGKYVVRQILDRVTTTATRSGWVHYMWIRPQEIFPMWKSAYVKQVTVPSGQTYVIGSGLYNLKVERCFVTETVDAAVALLQAKGTGAFAAFRDKASPFVFMDSYVFVLDGNGVAVVDPAFPSLEGRCLMDYKDATGKYVIRAMVAKLQDSQETWFSYMWPKPGEVSPSKKLAYVRKVELDGKTYLVGADFFAAHAVWMKF